MLTAVLVRSADERRLVVAAIAPFFLVNEVWLVATVGVSPARFRHWPGSCSAAFSQP